ncbi:MAG: MATE family efflux transporter, partial [Oscillibacter sp.]
MQQNAFFETLAPTKLFFRCAIPNMVAMAVTALYVVADGIFVGLFVGQDALAAVNLVMPLVMISFALSDMIAVGSSVQIAIRLGQKQDREASSIFAFCSALIVAISCVVGVASFF